jgi:hypothetical protein
LVRSTWLVGQDPKPSVGKDTDDEGGHLGMVHKESRLWASDHRAIITRLGGPPASRSAEEDKVSAARIAALEGRDAAAAAAAEKHAAERAAMLQAAAAEVAAAAAAAEQKRAANE